MRLVRSQFLRSFGRLGLAVRGAASVVVVVAAVLALPAAALAAKGVISTFGSAGTGPGQFSNAADGLRALAVDQASGNVYVVDGGNHRVQRLTQFGEFVSQLGSGSAGTAGGLFNSPFGVAVDPADGSVYVSDGLNLRVQKFSSSGSFIRAFGWDTIVPEGPPPNSSGTAFEVCDTTALIPNLPGDCKNGVAGTGDGQFGSSVTPFVTPFTGAPAVDPNTGAVYVADPGEPGATGRRIQRFNGATGAFEGKWGGEGTGLGQFGSVNQASPHRLAVDSTGAVYAVDVGSSGGGARRVQKCVPSGTPPAVTATCSLFATFADTPVAIAVDPSNDHVLVARRNGGNTSELVVDEFSSAGGPTLATHGVGLGMAQGLTAANVTTRTGLAVHGATGRIYLTFPSASSPRVWVLGDVPAPSATVAETTDVTSDSATLHATVTPAATGANGVSTLYRFEYSLNNGIDWLPATSGFVSVGNGSGSGDPGSCPTDNPPTCDVSLEVTGLDPGEDYRVRVVARTDFGGASVTVEGPGFATPSAPPVVATGPAVWSSPADTDPTLLLTGEVNPRGASATYRFEYVSEQEFAESGFDAAHAIPITPADAGSGRRSVVVRRSVSGLDPEVGYRYRLVTANGAGPANGDTRAVDPPQAGDRFYERVSNGDGWGIGIEPSVEAISDDGERAMFVAQGLGQPHSVPAVAMSYIAERGESGWEVHAPFPLPERAYGVFNLRQEYMTAPDLGEVIAPEAERLQRARAEVEWMRIGIDGARTAVSGLIKPVSFNGRPAIGTNYQWTGAAPDLSTFAFRYWDAGSRVSLFPDEQRVEGANQVSNLYAILDADTASSSLSLVNRATDPAPGVAGTPIGGVCGAGLGGQLHAARANDRTYRAISTDGSVIYFSAIPGLSDTGTCPGAGATSGPMTRVFKRVNGVSTVAVSESQCARVSPPCEGAGNDEYMGASTDGEVVVFTSPRQLTDSDLDVSAFGQYCLGVLIGASSCDLYVYDADPPPGQPNLVQASAGEVVPGDHPTVGSGARVTDVLDVSEDGSRVYFTATGVLTGPNVRGATPVNGQRNVYVYQRDDVHPEGRLEFVAPSVVNDTASTYTGFFALGSDGAKFVFTTMAAALPDEDSDLARDVYRYDDTTGELLCLSCASDANLDAQLPSGGLAGRLGYPNQAQRMGAATPDGSAVVFATAAALVAEDENSARDVYLWKEGEGLTLISWGTGNIGMKTPQPQPETELGVGVSPDGESVFFITEAPLVASDGNGGPDMYVARVGGGFPVAETSSEPCAVEVGCQGGGAGSVGSSSATSLPTDGGDVRPGDRVRLSVGVVSSARARRLAARSGVLRVRVRASRAGVVRLVARARVSGRVRQVGTSVVRLRRPGVVVASVRLSRKARARLRAGRALRVTVRAALPGVRRQTATVRLAGGRS